MTAEDHSAAARSIRRLSLTAFAVIVLLVIGVGGWAASAQLSGAIIGVGRLVVEGNVKKVQHQEGGIVGEIMVRNGTRTNAGDVLVRLDDTVPRANLGVIVSQVDQLSARQTRLAAERDKASELSVPDRGDQVSPRAKGYLSSEVRGGSVCLNSFGRLVKWISASIMPPPSSVPAR